MGPTTKIQMKKFTKISMIFVGLMLPASAEPKESSDAAISAEVKRLVGAYEIVSGQYGEKEIPKDRLEGKVRWGTKTIAGYDNDENKLYAAVYTLDSSTDPWTIEMTGRMIPESEDAEAKKFKSKGLVKIEDETVTLIYSTKDGEKPDDFEPEEEDHKFVFRKTAGE